jgi:hypothetical protein
VVTAADDTMGVAVLFTSMCMLAAFMLKPMDPTTMDDFLTAHPPQRS